MRNAILETDSYKLTHFSQYPEGTTGVFSYLESRPGAAFDETIFVGLQPILEKIEGCIVTDRDVNEAARLAAIHFGDPTIFNIEGWRYIVRELGGRLPIRIRAVPEGTPVPVGNVMMTVENTDPRCFWLTNAMESFLLHVWYPCTVASLSRETKKMIAQKLKATGCGLEGLPYMLHDFGYRGAATADAAAIGGMAHLVNFVGTDTLPAMLLAIDAYGADPATLAFSVPATEHSVMTALGKEGEMVQVQRLLDAHSTGIISCVADSYNIYGFVERICTDFKPQILARDGKFVVRPDSVTLEDPTPDLLVVRLLKKLYSAFGGTINDAGYYELNPKIGLLWGDGIDPAGIEKILNRMQLEKFAASNIVFGMGGGLLQKVNRDTQRFAFKSSAQERDDVWHDVFKSPLGSGKASKAGRLRLTYNEQYRQIVGTDREDDWMDNDECDLLELRFEDGRIHNPPNWHEVRERAAL